MQSILIEFAPSNLQGKLSIYCTLRILTKELEATYVGSEFSGYGYASETFGRLRWHLDSLIGADDDDGLGHDAHFDHVISNLNTLQELFTKHVKRPD